MARRGNIPKREVLADPIYNSTVITKLINQVMLDGKRGVAQKCVYDALDMIKEKTGRDPMEVFTECMENIKPQLEVKARRVGGATYQVPIEIDAANGTGATVKRREDMHRMAEANKAFAHYRW